MRENPYTAGLSLNGHLGIPNASPTETIFEKMARDRRPCIGRIVSSSLRHPRSPHGSYLSIEHRPRERDRILTSLRSRQTGGGERERTGRKGNQGKWATKSPARSSLEVVLEPGKMYGCTVGHGHYSKYPPWGWAWFHGRRPTAFAATLSSDGRAMWAMGC